jgi:hypothetical protein
MPHLKTMESALILIMNKYRLMTTKINLPKYIKYIQAKSASQRICNFLDSYEDGELLRYSRINADKMVQSPTKVKKMITDRDEQLFDILVLVEIDDQVSVLFCCSIFEEKQTILVSTI